MVPFAFQRGETILLALDVVDGDLTAVTAVAAAMKAVAAGGSDIGGGAAIPFAVTARPAEGGLPAGWTLTIDAAVSAALEPGLYRADARIAVAGGVVVTEPVSLSICVPVTAP